MGKDLADAFPVAKGVFGEVDAALGTDLSRLCFEGPADDLKQTENTQPALFAHGAAVWSLTKDALRASVRAAAGHSLGEFTAYHAADAVSLPGAAKLVRTRGELMFETGASRPGTMAAILGTTTSSIDEICARASSEKGLVVPANFNTDEQVVISGEIAGVERAMELAKEAGAKRTDTGPYHVLEIEAVHPHCQTPVAPECTGKRRPNSIILPAASAAYSCGLFAANSGSFSALAAVKATPGSQRTATWG